MERLEIFVLDEFRETRRTRIDERLAAYNDQFECLRFRRTSFELTTDRSVDEAADGRPALRGTLFYLPQQASIERDGGPLGRHT